MPEKNKKIEIVQVKINGKVLPIKDFVQDFIGLTILGMLSSLHGVTHPKEVEIKIKRLSSSGKE